MNFLQLAGLDVHRDVPLEEISARKAELVEAYLVAKMESKMSGKKLPKRFSDYGENLSHTDNVRNLMAFPKPPPTQRYYAKRWVMRRTGVLLLDLHTDCWYKQIRIFKFLIIHFNFGIYFYFFYTLLLI